GRRFGSHPRRGPAGTDGLLLSGFRSLCLSDALQRRRVRPVSARSDGLRPPLRRVGSRHPEGAVSGRCHLARAGRESRRGVCRTGSQSTARRQIALVDGQCGEGFRGRKLQSQKGPPRGQRVLLRTNPFGGRAEVSLVLLIPDGVGARNFLIGPFLRLACENWTTHVFHNIPEDRLTTYANGLSAMVHWREFDAYRETPV